MGAVLKLGRNPRLHDPRVQKLHEVRRKLGLVAPAVPASPVDYSAGTGDLGIMLNGTRGCCTSAAAYHRRQLVTFNTNPPMDTQPDAMVQKFYENFGFDPTQDRPDGSNPTDQGAAEQDVLAYWHINGIPLADGSVNKLDGFIEIDPTNEFDINWAITDCLGVYIGFEVPAYVMDLFQTPGSVIDVDPSADNTIVGGHAVWVPGHLANRNRRITSYGVPFDVTPAFWNLRVDEVYALWDTDLIAKATGRTILGLTEDQTAAVMQPFAEAA